MTALPPAHVPACAPVVMHPESQMFAFAAEYATGLFEEGFAFVVKVIIAPVVVDEGAMERVMGQSASASSTYPSPSSSTPLLQFSATVAWQLPATQTGVAPEQVPHDCPQFGSGPQFCEPQFCVQLPGTHLPPVQKDPD